jgi:uncharacterized protein YndB with AHSA1/START domain
MRDIVVIKDLPYHRSLVWQAVTNRDQLAVWLMPNDFEPRVGHEFTFRTDPAPGFDGIVRCCVLVLDEPEQFDISWVGGPLNTVLSIRLEETAAGTRLTLRHSGFAGFGNIIPKFLLGLGWRKGVMAKLLALLANRQSLDD